MDGLYTSGLQIIAWIQALGAWLTPIMKLFTFLGNEQFYLLVAPAILWCIDATLGLRLGLFLMINGMVNAALKVAFHGPRPYWYTSQAKVLGAAENSFGAPSGHAQNSVVVWGTLADWIKTRAAWIIAILLMFLIGISRIYLAVHFPHDVLLGWIFGIVLLWVMLKLEKPVVRWLKQYKAGIQLMVIFLFSLFLILLVVLAQLTLNGWSLPVEWINNAHLAFADEPVINPLSFHNFLTSTGAFLGLAAGWIWISGLGGYTTRDAWYKLVLRYLLGVVGVLILYVGLGSIFSDTETFISYAWRYIRYALIGFWISGFAPWIFIKLKLASQLEGQKNSQDTQDK
jgi:membrane-associated phospholipid phosphatase